MNEQPRALNENVSLGARVCDPQPVCLRVWLRLTEPRSSRVQTRHHFISPLPGRANPTFKHKGKTVEYLIGGGLALSVSLLSLGRLDLLP